MFLWLTSPSISKDGGKGFVFASPAFFNVSPQDKEKKRTLIASDSHELKILPFPVRTQKSEQVDETGQASGSGALLSQGGSVVYYGIHVNDVYAYFLTGLAAGKIDLSQDQFPTTQADLDQITNYVEVLDLPKLKTACVDAATVDDPSQFITLKASVPKFDRTDPVIWAPTGKSNRSHARSWECTSWGLCSVSPRWCGRRSKTEPTPRTTPATTGTTKTSSNASNSTQRRNGSSCPLMDRRAGTTMRRSRRTAMEIS